MDGANHTIMSSGGQPTAGAYKTSQGYSSQKYLPHLLPKMTGHPACSDRVSAVPLLWRLYQNTADPWKRKRDKCKVDFKIHCIVTVLIQITSHEV